MPRSNFHKALFLAPFLLVLMLILFLVPINDGATVLQASDFGLIPLIAGSVVTVGGTIGLGYLEWSLKHSSSSDHSVTFKEDKPASATSNKSKDFAF